MLMTDQRQQLKQLMSNVQPESLIPQTEQMVKVSSMMSPSDHAQFKGLSCVFVEVPSTNGGVSQIFSVRPQQMVPRSAVIQRDEESQLVGISAVSGG